MKTPSGSGITKGKRGVRQTLVLLVRLIIREYHRYNLLSMASALSYTTLLALVPVFAIVLGVVEIIREGMYSEMFISTLKNQIPAVAGMGDLVDAIREIAGDAKAIVGVGMVMFIATGFFLFVTVVKDFNRIWRVEKPRSFLARLSGFITAVILVPLLMILSLYVNLYVARTVDTLESAVASRPASESLPQTDRVMPPVKIGDGDEAGSGPGEDALAEPGTLSTREGEGPLSITRDRLIHDSDNPNEVSREVEEYRSGKTVVQVALRITSLLINILAMSAMYFLLPNRRVKWWAALSGGVIAGVILELGNHLFRIYAGMTSTVLMKIYGTLLAVPLSLIWLWLLWVIVLLGAVVGYVIQHFRELSEKAELEGRDRDSDLYIALLLAAEASARYRQGRSTCGLVQEVAVQTGFPCCLVRDILRKLIDNQVLAAVEGREEEVLPSRGVDNLTLDQVIFPLLGNIFSVSGSGADERQRRISEILARAGIALRQSLDRTTLSDLDPAPVLSEGEEPASDSA